MSKNLRYLSQQGPDAETLLEAMQRHSEGSGCLDDAAVAALAEARSFPRSALTGAASFYDFLRRDNLAKKAYICNGTVCRMSGRTPQAEMLLAQRYGSDEVGEMACVGHCFNAAGFFADGKTFDPDRPAGFGGGEAEVANSESPIPYFSVGSEQVFGEKVADPSRFYAALDVDPNSICRQLELSGLRGRGGAGFPFAMKLKSCAEMPAGQKYIVCNADEGDPGAFSDRYLLERQPHRVLAGMVLAGLTAGADCGYLYVRAEYPWAFERLTAAIAEFEQTELFSRTGFRFHLIRGAGSYVCGEETALLNSIEGLRPEVRVRPPFPAQHGLFGRPTLLSNVETFAAVPWIVINGGDRFAAIGNGSSTGTKLVSLDCSFSRSGVYEVDMGMPLSSLIEKAGGFRRQVKALQVGGPLGGVVPLSEVAGLTLDFESFDQAGFLLGHAGIVAVPHDFSMLELMRHLFHYMADESCGKCVPCRLGTRKGYQLLQNASPEAPVDMEVFGQLLETLEVGSLCALGGGLPLPIRNILHYFGEELDRFFQGRVEP
jgi:NADH:ubiquinone oxidoreductase subunit F (NADH-binding)/NADH:ubiquinone oxidoreductase subunit E